MVINPFVVVVVGLLLSFNIGYYLSMKPKTIPFLFWCIWSGSLLSLPLWVVM